MTTCHIAAIVKGVIERNDGTTHFGSTMAYDHHVGVAKEIGVIVEDEPGKLTATRLGVLWYKSKKMADLPYPSRANAWCLIKGYDDWALPAAQSDMF